MNATMRRYLIDCDWMDRAEIRHLNRCLVEQIGLSNGDDVTESYPGAYEAIGAIARKVGLTQLHTVWDDNREVSRLYVSPRGELVNAWVSGDALGFDDQPAGHEEE